MKKLFTIALALIVALSLSACGGGKEKTDDSAYAPVQPSQPLSSDNAGDKDGAPENGEAAQNQETGNDDANTDAPITGEVTPEFKEAMDSYEAFFDEYAEFMKKYSESDNPTAMLGDYSSMMTRYAETMEKLDEIDEDSLSAADALYYTEVMARINQKLIEAIQEG